MRDLHQVDVGSALEQLAAADIVAAHQLVESGEARGKIVVRGHEE